jgi:protein gp37
MAEETEISWADATFNAWIGCTRVSRACDACYAETQNAFRKWNGGTWGPGTPRKVMADAYWRRPHAWNKKAELSGKRPRVFCSSLADVFDNEAPAGQRDRLWATIRATPALDWLLLTKRPHNIARMLPPDWGDGYPNVWLGTTVEDQKTADLRVPVLLKVPAVVRFLSCEPLLGPVDLGAFVRPNGLVEVVGPGGKVHYRRPAGDPLIGEAIARPGYSVRGARDIHWVICGGENASNARPMHPAWARQLRDQCQSAGVAYHFKQWGTWLPADQVTEDRAEVIYLPRKKGEAPDAPRRCRVKTCAIQRDDSDLGAVLGFKVGVARAGRTLDGRTWDGFPEVSRG